MKFIIYDYANTPKEVELPINSIEEIKSLLITILSGDEKGTAFLKNGECIEFDASDFRLHDYYDGMYIIEDTEVLKKWFEYTPTQNRRTFSYERQELVRNGFNYGKL